ncbi:TadE family type IV pilus minor pilin [Cellulomonas sp. PhB143]|uniref:TadE family type IV pilus minor pilin n=1 Tax=Cellulomonas sp. PhB143 TaxID=2485186 RepID=UPI000F9C1DE0|nr:TadE family type IV pilus minor pilin [Cellulomonas sp. PhB143]ROS76578.1 hypothetical protein EDF32_1397 [Cellulomonas sp. PhB143]
MTAELAVALPAVVVVLVAVLALGAGATAQMRCADAARAAARAVAVGEDAATVDATVSRLAGSGASRRTSEDGDWVTVVVRAPVVGGMELGPLEARAEAVARVEP